MKNNFIKNINKYVVLIQDIHYISIIRIVFIFSVTNKMGNCGNKKSPPTLLSAL